ncbi:hypothetical protein AVEN_11767-1 [Araneus ventricosus]|uniref:Uncharacterized protein n=1 Tax=Araneus ventricosus TaxID=182803 RepID=A0A4Y2E8Y8_ARAVE|nr:hypothetical protein AVEN_102004-1 [Araneus ventricosus]GBM24314.1 hypothetical protein AVEN_251473-1 [Araneus ventricosus]GBM24321.1 hypothetical protein AVEN_262666-1 [Araneus ventricosus]GBM24335.1 hypothetical protein AVEN_11767-1 [Araneus ventricosus]
MRKTKIRGLSLFNPPISRDQKQGVKKAGDLGIFVGEYGFSYDPGINTDLRLNLSVKELVNKGPKGKRKNTLCFFFCPGRETKTKQEEENGVSGKKNHDEGTLLQL